ncbi:MAG: NAD(P)-dependent alcohol dehydrogenase [Balneolaceae bacterium]
MKAITFSEYGSPEKVLTLKNVPKPTPGENEVLVNVRASAINDYDWCVVRGMPRIYRLMFGLFKPKQQIPGMELAGVIESVGKNVTSFKIGDEVFGDLSNYGFGTFAEYVCINEKALVLKPKEMTFEEAATIPHASLLAVQGLIEVGKIKHGMDILINGAGGGVGNFALNIAKLYNAKVTGVDTGNKLVTMRSMGFDQVIDYKKKDFTKSGTTYDLILDAKTNKSTFDYLRVLKENGKYVTVGGQLLSLVQVLLFKKLISIFSTKRVEIVSLKTNKNLEYINKLFLSGHIKPIIDGPYRLEDVPKMIQYFGEAKHTGKIIISINN